VANFVAIKNYVNVKDSDCNMPIPTPLLPFSTCHVGVQATKLRPADATSTGTTLLGPTTSSNPFPNKV